jgi:alpha-L-fucosidase
MILPAMQACCAWSYTNAVGTSRFWVRPVRSLPVFGAVVLMLSAVFLSGADKRAPAGDVAPPQPYGALPSERQLRWHEMEFNAFLHFTVNTFTDREWGNGDEDPAIFNPTDFQPDAIASALAAAGVKGVILTAKHHDGFCLWPTKTTDHSIARSPWRNGAGDVVRDISDAARRRGLAFGVYLSPWDRNSSLYGTPEYVQLYRAQLRELLTGYGPIFEVWHDGANGGDGFYGGANEKRSIERRTYYDWPATWNLVRQLQPGAVIFSDVGPDIRWVGNEKGVAAETSWATYDPVGEDGGPAAPGYVRAELNQTGQRNAAHWLPAECDVSIRPGWFWHENENGKVKTPAQLFDLYTKCVGRGANLLLNVPPDRRGQLSEPDVRSLRDFGNLLKAAFRKNLALDAQFSASNVRGAAAQYSPKKLVDGDRYTYWATDDGVTTPELTIDFKEDITFAILRLRENIKLGQRVEEFAFDSWDHGDWREIARATSIGACRIITLDQPVTTRKLRLRIVKSPMAVAISELGVYTKP